LFAKLLFFTQKAIQLYVYWWEGSPEIISFGGGTGHVFCEGNDKG